MYLTLRFFISADNGQGWYPALGVILEGILISLTASKIRFKKKNLFCSTRIGDTYITPYTNLG